MPSGLTPRVITILVLQEVGEERVSQDQKWGVQNHDDMTWTAILAEEMGEAAQAALEARPGPPPSDVDIREEDVYEISPGVYNTAEEQILRDELIQTAAVAVAWIEAIDRRNTY